MYNKFSIPSMQLGMKVKLYKGDLTAPSSTIQAHPDGVSLCWKMNRSAHFSSVRLLRRHSQRSGE
jgi:hypothetical protein